RYRGLHEPARRRPPRASVVVVVWTRRRRLWPRPAAWPLPNPVPAADPATTTSPSHWRLAQESRSSRSPNRAELRIGQRWALASALSERAEQLLAALLQLRLADRPPHELRNYSTLVLAFECPVKLRLDFVGHAEVNGCHGNPHC